MMIHQAWCIVEKRKKEINFVHEKIRSIDAIYKQ